jgi:hypothetical protein
MLPGFKFNTANIKSKLYVDGTPLVDKVKIKMDLNSTEQINNKMSRQSSGIESGGEYSGVDLPSGGVDVNVYSFLDKQEDLKINLDVSLAAGTTINAADLDNPEIAVELVIWLPLEFIAGDNAEFKLPFDGMGEFLISIAESEMIENLSLNIGLNKNPFSGGKFVIQNLADGYKIECPIEEASIGFNIKKEDVDYINKEKENQLDFQFNITFNKDAVLGIHRTLKIMTVSLEANVDHTISLGGGE